MLEKQRILKPLTMLTSILSTHFILELSNLTSYLMKWNEKEHVMAPKFLEDIPPIRIFLNKILVFQMLEYPEHVLNR